MLRLTSNLDQVIERTLRYRDSVPVAMARALDPARWRTRLQEDAQRVLAALAEPNERPFIPAFISTLSAVTYEGGLVVRLEAPTQRWVLAAQPSLFQSPPNQSGPRYQRPDTKRWTQHDPNVRFEAIKLATQDYERFFDLVHQWVEEEKRWDTEIDRDKNPRNVFDKAMFITRLLLAPDLSEAEARARDLLLPHILDFIARQTAVTGLDPATADLWLKAVLMQWTATVTREFPDAVRRELRLLRTNKSASARTE